MLSSEYKISTSSLLTCLVQFYKSDRFAFVIQGGAGAVVASRLSEIDNWKVLLLEAGGHETELTDVPLLSLYLHKSKLDWKYR